MKGTESVYAAIYNGGSMTAAGYYNVSDGKVNISSRKSVATRALSCDVTMGDSYDSSYEGVTATFCQLVDNESTITSNPWKMTDIIPLVGEKTGKFAEYKNNRQTYLFDRDDFAKDVVYETTEESTITLTYIFGGAVNWNMLFYYYWPKDDDSKRNEATRYILINDGRPQKNVFCDANGTENENDSDPDSPGLAWVDDVSKAENGNAKSKAMTLYGTEYKLTYFDEDDNSSYEFPSEYNVAFGIIVNRADEAASTDDYQSKAFYSTQTDNAYRHLWMSTGNADSDGQYGVTRDQSQGGEISAVTYIAGDNVILAFEDQPYTKHGDQVDVDMNDLMFTLQGKINKEKIPEIPINEPEGQSWILAAEDLGNMDDFDFNDVVASVTYVSGQTKATVKALAAGGTLPIYLTYKPTGGTEQSVGEEFHKWFGDGNISSETMINTTEITYKGDQLKEQTITVPEDFSMATCSEDDYDTAEGRMGGFGIKVVRSDGEQTTVTPPQKGDAPQMLCLPATWQWPMERVSISEAYTDFGDWGANYKNSDWLNNYNEYYVISVGE